MDKKLDLLCIGNAIVDVFGRDESGIALRYELCEPVQHVEIERLKTLPGELNDATRVSGGGAANAAKIAGLLGAKACFIGAIGSDSYGRLFEEDLKHAGVETHLAHKPSPTGLCLVLQTGDGTRIAASPSAALELTEEDINEEEVEKAKALVIDGFVLGRRGLVRRLLALATKHGTAVAIDLGSAAIAAEEAAEIAANVAPHNAAHHPGQQPFFLFMNEDEAISYHNAINHQAQDFEQAAAFFKAVSQENPSLAIVVKLGKHGAVFFAKGEVFNAETEAVEPLESTGAGDAFCGAFLTAWARGKPLSECAALGNKAAKVVLGSIGTKVDTNAFRNLSQGISSTL